jgi:hypothetical protein
MAPIVLLLLACFCIHAQEQLPKEIPILSDETQQKLSELLFPLDALKSSGGQFVLILRYRPSFEEDSQYVIVGGDGKVHVTEYTSNGNVWYKANEIFGRTGRDDAIEIAKMIGVRKREFDIPFAQLRRWRSNLIDSIAVALRPKKVESIYPGKYGTVILDGTTYDIWDSSGAGVIHFSLYDSEVSDRIYPDDPAFVRWMKLIRRELRRRK